MLIKFKNLIFFIIIIALIGAGFYFARNYYRAERLAKQGPKPRPEKNLTIIPGWNLQNIEDYLKKQGYNNRPTKLKVADYQADYTFLNDAPTKASLEGYLTPDTYRVYADTTSTDVIIKALNNFAKNLKPGWLSEIKRRNLTIYQVVTMASIIEKEVKLPADMKIVSGIFWQRIKTGQGLQSCATLAYVLGVNKEQYSLADTKIDSPYNTYKYRGLPPGPICNPSLPALQAAIYPETSNYNYFLSRPDTGETVFSKTYDEQVKNKFKYLK